MHFLLAVILHPNTSNIPYAVERAMERFQANTVTEEYIEFVEECKDYETVQPLDHWNEEVRGRRWADIFPTLADYAEDEGFELDAKTGKYGEWRNPNGMWSSYTIGGEWSASIQGKPIGPVAELPTDLVFAVLTPDGEWLDEAMWPTSPETWLLKVKELLARFSDCVAVAVDCHS